MKMLENLDVKQQITEQIIYEICAGNFQEGQEIRQEQIARELGVSRIPVREAFILLETMGYIRKLPNRRIEVIGFSEDRVRMEFALQSKIEYEILSSAAGLKVNPDSLREDILDGCQVVSISRIYDTLLKGSYQYVLQVLKNPAELKLYDEKVCEYYEKGEMESLLNTLETYYKLLYTKGKECKKE